MNKLGEIVFDDDGKVIEVNGYDGGRKSFEYIELSEYYSKLDEMHDELLSAKKSIDDVLKILRRLI